jgi:hypothetical protein
MRTTGAIGVRWVLACALAETIGMAAAASAARIGNDLADGDGTWGRWLALVVVVGGGLVEGAALGLLQGAVLASRWPSLSRARFLVATMAVAGIGWAAASAPSVLAGDSHEGSGPALGLVVLGALGIGVVLGPVLGAAQAVALHGAVGHPWHWVSANLAAWPPAMALIFVGASTAGAGWSTLAVAGYGAVTGALAGGVLGLVSAGWLGSLDGQPLANRIVLALVARRRLGLDRSMVGLAVRGRRTGRVLRFPVEYASDGDDMFVVPGHAERKTWWRNVDHGGTHVDVLVAGSWLPAEAELLLPGDPEYVHAATTYRRRWRHFEPEVGEPVVVLAGLGAGIAARSASLESVV